MNSSEEFDYSTLLASAVHDMKNSLNMLLNSIEQAIPCYSTDCANQDLFSRIQYEGKRLNDDLIGLLAIYRIQNQQYSANIDEHSVSDFLLENLAQHEVMIRHRNIDKQFNCADDLYGFFDRDLITGVISNVINNLYKYTEDKIALSASQEDNYLVIRIMDNGPGYPEHMLLETESPQQPLSFENTNTGLGLYFSSLVAKLHKNKGRTGFIRTSNTGIDGGGCFSLYLP